MSRIRSLRFSDGVGTRQSAPAEPEGSCAMATWDDIKKNDRWIRTHPESAHERWMESLPGALQLNQLVVPGAHDAGSFGCHQNWYEPNKTRYSKAQQLNFREQLFAGVRYLDLRVKHYGDNKTTRTLGFFHGSCDAVPEKGSTAETLDQLLEDVDCFTRSNDKEIVILHFARLATGPFDTATLLKRLRMVLGDRLLGPGDDGAPAAQRTLQQVWDGPGRIVVLWCAQNISGCARCTQCNQWVHFESPHDYAKMEGKNIPVPGDPDFPVPGDRDFWGPKDVEWAHETLWFEDEFHRGGSWANTMKWAHLEPVLRHDIEHFSPATSRAFLRIQPVFTPPDPTTLLGYLEFGAHHVVSSAWDLAVLAPSLNKTVAKWLKEEPMKSASGIVSVDYFNVFTGDPKRSDSVFVDTLIELNRARRPPSSRAATG